MYHILLQFERNSNSSASSASMKFNPALPIISLSKFGGTRQFLKPLWPNFWPKHTYPFGYGGRRRGPWDNVCECLKFKLRKEKRKKSMVNWWLPEQRHVVASGDAGHFFRTNESTEEIGITSFLFNRPQNFARTARSINGRNPGNH